MFGYFAKVLLCLLLIGAALPAEAGRFGIVDYRGGKAIRFSGDIEAGDALRFLQLRDRVQPFAHGHRVLILDSPGGDVDEALLIAALMRDQGFHTVVGAGTECGSACASVIFLAGAVRTVEPGGVLGQHSCSIGGQRDLPCNRMMADFAVSLGVSYAAVAEALAQVEPDDMRYFDRAGADARGLTRYFGQSDDKRRMQGGTTEWRVDFIGDGFRAFAPIQTDYGKRVELSLYCLRDDPTRVYVGLGLPGSLDSAKRAVAAVTVAMGDVTSETPLPLMSQQGSHVALEAGLPVAAARLLEAEGFEISAMTRDRDRPLAARVGLDNGRDNIAFAMEHCSSRTAPRN
ncbi:MAG: hypothetical protein Q4G36_10250 [Paracoccus sp. (in: a-proteobacteria)]|nr:hypothetical protein [Paracoccus sp. (in: a-proteobacteria)]